jgi:23S rRNA pseudouridine1911/1915/1917 synthase
MSMTPRSAAVSANQDENTLAAVVRALMDDLPWTRARELCRTGRVSVDGMVELDPARRVRTGMHVAVSPTAPRLRTCGLGHEAIALCDRDVVVVRKPPGIVTVPYAPGERGSLRDLAATTVRRCEGGTRSGPLRVVQRLDKDTSGLLVFARNRRAERHLQQQLRTRTVERRYLAIVHGRMGSGSFESMLVADRGDGLRGSWGRRRGQRGPAPEGARQAVTHVEVVEPLAGATLVSCSLDTGRQHQIRIHLSEAGHALVGETVYVREHPGPRIDAPRVMLHAQILGFRHPRSERWVRFFEAAPPDFCAVLERLRRPAGRAG